MMTFQFLALPPEVRNKVYRILFVSQSTETIVTPDPTGSRRRNGLASQTLKMSANLLFLETYQRVHEEASAVLYGTNIFKFDD